MCAQYGKELDDTTCKLAITRYRQKRALIAAAWRDLQQTAADAIRNPSHTMEACRCKFIFGNLKSAGFHALQITLPSGHKLTYPLARLQRVTKHFDSGPAEIDEIQFWGPNRLSSGWGWQSTYGGKILENIVQAIGGDFMTHGLLEAQRRGYMAFATIHDQALCEMKPGQTAEGLREALCVLPEWAKGFPLEAKVDVTPFYTKD